MGSNPPPLPNPQHWWQHWLFKAAILGAIAVVLAIASFYLIERQLGERAWQNYQRNTAARGGKLRLAEFVKGPVPDEENYAAAPIFQNLFSDPVSAKKLESTLQLPELPRKKPNERISKHFDLKQWQKAFVGARWIPAGGTDPAADVLTALHRLDQPLSEIRTASQRPKCRWPIKWEDGFAAKYPQMSILSNASTALALRAIALLEQRKPAEAMEEIKHAIRAAESLTGEPTLIPAVVRMAIWNQVLNVAEQGLVENLWEESHIQDLSRELSKAEFIGPLQFAMHSERGMGNQLFDQLMASDRSSFANSVGGLSSDGSPEVKVIFFCLPRGWIRRNQVEYNQLIDLDLEDIDVPNGRIDPRFGRSSKVIEEHALSPLTRIKHFLPSLLLAVHETIAYKLTDAHVRAQQLQMACAAVRFRQENGEFPTSLESLVPAYLAKVSLDPMDGHPLRYRRTENGGCVLWSIGTDRVDDGGKAGRADQSRTKAPDWVIELPALKQSHEADR